MHRIYCKLSLSLLAGVAFASAQANTVMVRPTSLDGDWAPAIVRAFHSANPGDEVVIPTPAKGQIVRLLTPVVLYGDPFLKVSLRFDGDWNSLQSLHSGPAFRFVGLKHANVHLSGLLLTQDNSQGVVIDGDATHTSTSSVVLTGGISTSAKRCTGVQIGSATSNDVSEIMCQGMSFSAPEPGGTLRHQLAAVHANGNRGFQILGGNTLMISFRDCCASGCDIAFSSKLIGTNSGGSGALFDGCGGSFNVLSYWLEGGMSWRVVGGRWELGGALVLHGDPLTGGRQNGRLTVEDVVVDGFDASSNRSLGYVDDGAIFGIYSNSVVRIDGVGAGVNKFDPAKWLAVRSNHGTGPSISVARSLGGLKIAPLEGKFVSN